MTVDEITFALKSSDAAPLAALRAGLAKAEELAPLVFATADKLCRGVYLYRKKTIFSSTAYTFLRRQGTPSSSTVL